MASRSIRVQFLSDQVANEVVADPEVHDVSIGDDVQGVPAVLENPHVDFPGMWQLVDDGTTGGGYAPGGPSDAGPGAAVAAGTDPTGSADTVHRYARYDAVGQTNNVRID